MQSASVYLLKPNIGLYIKINIMYLYRYYDICKTYRANVCHIPGFCLLDIDGAPPNTGHKNYPLKHFHIYEFFLKLTIIDFPTR